MDNRMKSKITGWGATVGLAALALLGNAGGAAQATVATTDEAAANRLTVQDTSATGTAITAADGVAYQVAQASPPPPPPRPPAVGAVRG
jgi:hypothetical protein